MCFRLRFFRGAGEGEDGMIFCCKFSFASLHGDGVLLGVDLLSGPICLPSFSYAIAARLARPRTYPAGTPSTRRRRHDMARRQRHVQLNLAMSEDDSTAADTR